MNHNEIYTEIKALYEAFDAAHNGNKKRNFGDARKALGEIKKLVTTYRAASVEAQKNA